MSMASCYDIMQCAWVRVPAGRQTSRLKPPFSEASCAAAVLINDQPLLGAAMHDRFKSTDARDNA